ncbi:MAG: SLC13 family permease [Chloroflexi bacterium]|nr:SLC13 family permease [Chloroflexota bacterium]
MGLENILILLILIGSVALFVSEKLRVDVVAMLVLLALLATGLITVEEAFSGFASPAVVTVWAVFIISGGLSVSGVADLMARWMLRLVGSSEVRLLTVIMLAAGVMSAFMNNIGAVAILLPAVISLGRKLRIAASKLLIPLAFAALLGGNMTLIGTPPNILAASIMADYGVPPFGFFDFLPTGLLALAVGMIYMLLLGRHLLPERPSGPDLSNQYRVRDFLTEVRLDERSPLLGRLLSETDFGENYNLNVLYVRQPPAGGMQPPDAYRLAAGDILLLEGTPQEIVDASQQYRLLPVQEWTAVNWHPETYPDEFHLAEVTLAPNSRYENKTIKQIDLRKQYGLSVLAIRHNGEDQAAQLGDVPLRFGDSLLVQGPDKRVAALLNDPDLLPLEAPVIELRRTHKAPIAIIILLLVVVGAAVGVFPIAPLMLAGAMAMVIFRVIDMDEAYRAIDWKAIFLIAGMLPLGIAMETTGTARLLAGLLVNLTGEWGAVVVLGCVFILTAVLTEVISNAAAAVLVVPLAIDVALGLGVDARPFVMATVLAASTSFLMPVGHQVNVLIFGAGGYKFSDYARVGVGLNLLMLLLVVVVVPLVWPFTG